MATQQRTNQTGRTQVTGISSVDFNEEELSALSNSIFARECQFCGRELEGGYCSECDAFQHGYDNPEAYDEDSDIPMEFSHPDFDWDAYHAATR